MHDCLISFGSNIGNSAAYFRETAQRLTANRAIVFLRASHPIATRPTGGPPGQADYLNGCFRFRTSLTIECLFGCLRQIETDFGRERRERWGERTIDLDLLLFDAMELVTGSLTIPHPRMSFRRFVLRPASQIAAEMIHITSGRSIGQLLEHLNSKPDRITLAAGPEMKSGRMHDRIQQLCQSAGWACEIITKSESLEAVAEKTKLLVYSSSAEPELQRLAMTFPGPTLNLGIADERHTIVEVQAAIEAMRVP